ncbi:Zinc finger C3HC4 RING-type [Trinorchestia longiramus]|nr:Zinc finger C3HC4 RING-type [Trinorchestia longiramus]
MESECARTSRSHDTQGLQYTTAASPSGVAGDRQELNGSSQGNGQLDEEEQEKEVWCAICLSVLRQPRQLPCRHAFCLQCLEKMVRKGGAVLRCPNCRRSALLPRDGVAALPMDSSLLMVVKKVRERRRIRIKKKKCKVCSGCAELQLCTLCPHCAELYCSSCTADHAQALKTQVDAVMDRLEKFKKQLQLESLREKKRSKENQKLPSSGADEDLRRCRGHKRVLSTLKRALSSCKTFSAPDGESPLPAGDVPSSPEVRQIQSLSRQLVFLLKLTSTIENELLHNDVREVFTKFDKMRCAATQNYGTPKENLNQISVNTDGKNQAKEQLLIDFSSNDDISDMNRSPQSSAYTSPNASTGSLSNADFRLSRSTIRKQVLVPGRKYPRSHSRPQRHQSYHGIPDLSNPLRSTSFIGELDNSQNWDQVTRSRSYSRCGSLSGSSISHSRSRVHYVGFYSGDDDEEDADSTHGAGVQQQTPPTADSGDPRVSTRLLATMPLADLRQGLEDQSLLYRCKPSRSLQRLSHRSFLRRPTDLAWCPWNGMVYVTVSQLAKLVEINVV